MRWPDRLLLAFIAVAMLVTLLAVAMLGQAPCEHQKRNAYWPYSVETVVLDR